MSDPISREALIEELKSLNIFVCAAIVFGGDTVKASIIKMLGGQQTVDAAPMVYGRWIDMDYTWECSVCHAQANRRMFSKNLSYCPNCGAKMDKEDGE